jgi:hypothetical protein
MDDGQVEALLMHGKVVRVEDIGTGITKPLRVTQMKGSTENLAVFKYVDSHPQIATSKYYNSKRNNESDRYQYEIAAYKLDRMLNLQLVPAAALATVNGKQGVLQDWIIDSINERDRLEEKIPFEGPCNQDEQYRLRFVFDILIYNEDRNLTNIIWTNDDFMMMFIDHTRAFRSTKRRLTQLRKVSLSVSNLLEEKLKSLDESELTTELGAYLHPKQIEAIIARRDLILEQMDSTGTW